MKQLYCSTLICVTVCVIVGALSGAEAGQHLVGGLSDGTKPADDEVRAVVEKVFGQIEEQTNQKYKSIEPLSYKVQVVAGLNYFVKAKGITQDNQESIMHLRIYKHFRDPAKLSAVKASESLESPIVHFP